MVHHVAVPVRIVEDGGSHRRGVAGVQKRGGAAAGGDEQLVVLGDVDAVGGDGAVQVLHEEPAPQHGPRHPALPQRLLDRVVRDEPGPVCTEHRHVHHVPAARLLRGLHERHQRRPGGLVARQREQQEQRLHPVEGGRPGGAVEEVEVHRLGPARLHRVPAGHPPRTCGVAAGEHLHQLGADVARGSGDHQHGASALSRTTPAGVPGCRRRCAGPSTAPARRAARPASPHPPGGTGRPAH